MNTLLVLLLMNQDILSLSPIIQLMDGMAITAEWTIGMVSLTLHGTRAITGTISSFQVHITVGNLTIESKMEHMIGMIMDIHAFHQDSTTCGW